MEIRPGGRRVRWLRLLPLLAALCPFSSARAQAVAYYWDTNGATAGSSDGTTASGYWSRGYGDLNWSTSPTGTDATENWPGPRKATFSAGTNATGTSTVTVRDYLEIAGLDFRQGLVIINGFALNEVTSGAGYTFNAEAGATGFIDSDMRFQNSTITKTGAGQININNDFTFEALTVNGGTLVTGANTALSGGPVTIGSTGTATLEYRGTQFGGVTSRVALGTSAGSSGTLVIHSTSTGYGIMRDLIIGQAGAGRVDIDGGYFGTATLTDLSGPTTGIVLGTTATGSGTINVNSGGTLQVPALANGLVVGAGSGVVNFTDGTMKIVTNLSFTPTTFSSTVPMTFTGASTFDTNGYDAALYGSLTGTGSLTKVGNGTLTLAGSAGYAGPTTLAGGSLTLAAGAVLQSPGGVVLAPDIGSNVTLTAQSGGILRLNGGAGITKGAGTASIQFSGGQLEILDHSASIALPMTLNATTSMVVNDGWSGYLSGVLSGTGGVRKYGTGTLVLSADNDYSGPTIIEAGRLSLGNFGPTGSVTGDIINKGEVQFARSNNVVFDHVISGTGSLTHTGAGTLQFTQPQTYTGWTNVYGGSLVLSATADYGLAASSVVVLFRTLDMSGRNQKIGGLIGFGTVTSSGSPGTTLTLDVATEPVGFFSGVLGGEAPDFSVVKSGPGTQILAGANTYTGTTTIDGGTLILHGWTALPESDPEGGGWSPTKLTVASGGTLALDLVEGDFSSRDIQTISAIGTASGGFQSGSALGLQNSFGTFRLEDALADPNGGANALGLTKLGAGTLELAASSTYSGPTTLEAGTIRVATDSVVDDGNPAAAAILSGATGVGVLQVNDGTIDLGGRSFAVGGLSGSGGTIGTAAGGRDSTANRLTIVTTGTHSFGGTIVDAIEDGSHSVSVEIMGSGTQVLTGVNTYTGDTTIHSGRLHLTGSATSSHFNVNSGGTLSGTGALGTLTIQSGGILSPGSSPGTLFTGSEEWHGGGNLTWEIASTTPGGAGAQWDLLSITGSLSLLESMGSENPFTIHLVSLANATTAGRVPDFDYTASYSFLFATTTVGILDFSADEFAIDASAFQNPFGGTWSVEHSGNDLFLLYTGAPAIPEPTTYAAFLGGIALAVAGWRRRRTAA